MGSGGYNMYTMCNVPVRSYIIYNTVYNLLMASIRLFAWAGTDSVLKGCHLKIVFPPGELYLTQYCIYSWQLKELLHSKTAPPCSGFLTFLTLQFFTRDTSLLNSGAILVIAWYVVGKLFFVTLQANNKRR
jgi:hypothetical protein